MARLSNKQKAFIEEYLTDFNATQAAIRAGYSERTAAVIGHENLRKPNISDAIQARLDEMKAGADEVLVELTGQMRADLGDFFKVVERWTFEPLPTHEILDEEEVPVEKGTRTRYKVRSVALDADKLTNPEYSHLLKKFTDSSRAGLQVELHDKQGAAKLLGQAHRLFVERQEVDTRLTITGLDSMLDKVYGRNDNEDRD